MSIWEDFIPTFKTNETPVYVFLCNGVRLDGVITEVAFDGLILTKDNNAQPVMKHAIATVLAK